MAAPATTAAAELQRFLDGPHAAVRDRVREWLSQDGNAPVTIRRSRSTAPRCSPGPASPPLAARPSPVTRAISKTDQSSNRPKKKQRTANC